MPILLRTARPTASTKIELTVGSVSASNAVGAVDPQAVKDPKGCLSHKLFDLSHARYLLHRRPPGIEADQATFPPWNRRSCFVSRERETISSHMD
jgi:hypothetical protein